MGETSSTYGSFRERYRDYQYVALELTELKRHNDAVLSGVHESGLLLHSMLALTAVGLERFLRLVLGAAASERDTLPNLLQKATGRRLRLFELDDRTAVIEKVNGARRFIAHGGLGVHDEAVDLVPCLVPFSFYFWAFLNAVVAAFDTETGQPRGTTVSFESQNVVAAVHVAVPTPLAELGWLNRHNKGYAPGDPQDGLLLLAEGALCLAVIEAAARRWVDVEAAPPGTPFPRVLREATAAGLRMPFEDPDDGIERLANVRRSLVHGNFEQAAHDAGCRDVDAYFREQYASEIEAMYCVCLDFLRQERERDEARL